MSESAKVQKKKERRRNEEKAGETTTQEESSPNNSLTLNTSTDTKLHKRNKNSREKVAVEGEGTPEMP